MFTLMPVNAGKTTAGSTRRAWLAGATTSHDGTSSGSGRDGTT